LTIHSGGIFSFQLEIDQFDDSSRQVDDMAIRLTEKDWELLALLGANARTPVSTLAKKLSLSRTTVQTRLERLEHEGVIAGYGIRLSEAYASGLIQAHVLITIAPKALAQVVAALERIQAVTTLHSVSGSFDLIAIIAAPSIVELDRAIDEIGTLQGVGRTISLIILSTRIARRMEMKSDVPGTERLKLLDETK
jgi:DNA-binding Lrp family transcriptional regulator